ncbi:MULTISPECIES: DUF4124 domain-containing protein [Dyella]|nr:MULTISPECIES: DUF4124 domain-containing protein [Dyella]
MRSLARSGAWLIAMGMVTAVMTTAVSAQEVYKWTDAAGTVHYGQQPPPTGASKMTLRGGVTTTQPAQVPTQGDEPKKSMEEVNSAKLKELCQTARRNLELVDSQSMIVGQGDIGNATQVSGEARTKARADAQANIGEYCHG